MLEYNQNSNEFNIMQIYPAIDLRNGRCVRLYQGKFEQETVYGEDPFAIAEQFVLQGASWLHIVDLDGAKNPEQSQFQLIKSLCEKLNLNIQTGGGIRQEWQIKTMLDAGLNRVVIGSQAVKEPEEVKQWFDKFGADRLVLALDVQQMDGVAYIATHGWQEISKNKLSDLIDYYLQVNLQHVLCTDISKDGTLTGPNLSLYQNLLQQYPRLQLQASGGISSLSDIGALRQMSVAGAILGKALYENKFTLQEALTC